MKRRSFTKEYEESIVYNGIEITYRYRKSNRRTLGICVRPDLSVTVAAKDAFSGLGATLVRATSHIVAHPIAKSLGSQQETGTIFDTHSEVQKMAKNCLNDGGHPKNQAL